MTNAIKTNECKYITSMEEYLSIPQEDRDKALEEFRYFLDNSDVLIKEAINEAIKEQLEAGFPISYGDKQGRVLRRYPDGRIFKITINKQTYEITETFYRMATPEDNYWER